MKPIKSRYTCAMNPRLNKQTHGNHNSNTQSHRKMLQISRGHGTDYTGTQFKSKWIEPVHFVGVFLIAESAMFESIRFRSREDADDYNRNRDPNRKRIDGVTMTIPIDFVAFLSFLHFFHGTSMQDSHCLIYIEKCLYFNIFPSFFCFRSHHQSNSAQIKVVIW